MTRPFCSADTALPALSDRTEKARVAAETDWLVSPDPARLFAQLEERGALASRAAPRKLRLLACAVLRAAWPRLTDGRIGLACQVAERREDGRATLGEIEYAQSVASLAIADARNGTDTVAGTLAHLACDEQALLDPEHYAQALQVWAGELAPPRLLADLVRELWGPVHRLPDACVTAGWLQGTVWEEQRGPGSCRRSYPSPGHHARSWGPAVLDAARSCHLGGAAGWDRLHTLHSALLHAGCENAEILAHLGGWVLPPCVSPRAIHARSATAAAGSMRWRRTRGDAGQLT